MLYLIIIIAIIIIYFFVKLKNQASSSNSVVQAKTNLPEFTITVTREEKERQPPPKVDFDKLEGFERKTFELISVGVETGRKRKKVVHAIDEEEARKLAISDGIIVKEIHELPDEPASENQKEYAKSLKIEFDDSITLKQMSYLISAATEEPAAEFQIRFAKNLGVKFNKYSFKSSDYLNNAIRKHLGYNSTEYYCAIAKCYVYSVSRYLSREKWDDPINCKMSEEKVNQIANKLASDERIMKSMLRQIGNRMDITYFDSGESRETIAYNATRELIINS